MTLPEAAVVVDRAVLFPGGPGLLASGVGCLDCPLSICGCCFPPQWSVNIQTTIPAVPQPARGAGAAPSHREGHWRPGIASVKSDPEKTSKPAQRSFIRVRFCRLVSRSAPALTGFRDPDGMPQATDVKFPSLRIRRFETIRLLPAAQQQHQKTSMILGSFGACEAVLLIPCRAVARARFCAHQHALKACQDGGLPQGSIVIQALTTRFAVACG